jgi:hypothetical protein
MFMHTYIYTLYIHTYIYTCIWTFLPAYICIIHTSTYIYHTYRITHKRQHTHKYIHMPIHVYLNTALHTPVEGVLKKKMIVHSVQDMFVGSYSGSWIHTRACFLHSHPLYIYIYIHTYIYIYIYPHVHTTHQQERGVASQYSTAAHTLIQLMYVGGHALCMGISCSIAKCRVMYSSALTVAYVQALWWVYCDEEHHYKQGTNYVTYTDDLT